LVQFSQSIRLSSAFCAASFEPNHSTEHLLPFVPSIHVAIVIPLRSFTCVETARSVVGHCPNPHFTAKCFFCGNSQQMTGQQRNTYCRNQLK
jgi:hypothetical protein